MKGVNKGEWGFSVSVFTSVSNSEHKKHNPSKPLVQTSGFISEEKMMAVKDYKSHGIDDIK